MTTLNSILLEAAPAGGGGMSTLLMIGAMVVIFYFFMIRPQQKQRKELKKQREAMGPGSKVITSGGIHGTIRQITDQVVMLEIAKGVTIKVGKDMIYPLEEAASKSNAKSADKEEKGDKDKVNLKKDSDED